MIDNILDEKVELTFKLNNNEKLMPHVVEEYSDNQLRELYDMYSSDTNYNYSLKVEAGKTITGKLHGESSKYYTFDIGYKDLLIVEKRKEETTALISYAEDDVVKYGTKVDILITLVDEDHFKLEGSIAQLFKDKTYDEMINGSEPIDAKVVSLNKAGFSVLLEKNNFSIPAFMPNTLAGVNRLTAEELQELEGQTIEVMIESYSPEKDSFIASRKKYLQSLIPAKIAELKTVDDNGEPIPFEGIVTGTKEYGVFVEFNDILTGMIHKDNLSDEAKQVFDQIKPKDEIAFYVRDVINNKLTLTQMWKESLWDTISQGDNLTGEISAFKHFGVLVRFDQETVGLLKKSEYEKLNTRMNVGDPIDVKVFSVHKSDRKIFLTID